MATPKKTKKTIYYKRSEINLKGITLQQYVEKALSIAKKTAQRVENLDSEGTIKRFINSFRPLKGMIFGQMMRYEPGKDQVVFILDDESEEYPVENFSPEKEDGKTREFLESTLYFGIFENHVVVLQSQSLKARDLECYLSWLLGEKTKVIPPETVFCLSDQPTKEAREKIEKSHVRNVVIGAPLQSLEIKDGVQKTSTNKVSFRPYGKGFDVISAFLGEDWLQKLKLKDSLDDANLRVNLEITYFRKTTTSAHDVLDTVATALRHLEPNDVKINLEGGGSLKGSDLKFSGDISVKTLNGIIDTSDLYHEMHSWIYGKISEGKIT